MAVDDEKPTFRCLDWARYAVASAVTMLIVVVIVYAAVQVLRPGDLSLKVLGGYVSVDRNTSTPENITFHFTLRAINQSVRIRIYYTGISCLFSGKINGSAKAEDFILFPIPDLAVEQQSLVDSLVEVIGIDDSDYMTPEYFNWLFKGDTIDDVMLSLTGFRIVEIYSGRNTTAKVDTIYCPSITVGGDSPEDTPADVQCTDRLRASSTSST